MIGELGQEVSEVFDSVRLGDKPSQRDRTSETIYLHFIYWGVAKRKGTGLSWISISIIPLGDVSSSLIFTTRLLHSQVQILPPQPLLDTALNHKVSEAANEYSSRA